MRLFDLHCDTITVCEHTKDSLCSNSNHIDLKRGLSLLDHWVQVMAIYIPDGLKDREAYDRTIRTMAYLEQEVNNSDRAVIAYDAQTLSRSLTEHICVVLPAIENGAAIGNDLNGIAWLAEKGVVSVNLTWNNSNRLGHGCMSRNTDGLTSFGKEAVKQMVRWGIVPDVSHLNTRGFWDVVALSEGRPFIAGHSVSDAVHHHPRNLTDDQFREIALHRGLVGLNLCKDQLGAHTFDQLYRHLDHFLSLGGEHIVALGMDLDGTELPSSWNGIAVTTALYEWLLQKNIQESVLDQLFFKNSYDFFAKSLTSKAECIRIGT